MSDPIEEAVRRLRGLKERVDRLEGQREGQGQINLFRTIFDRTNTDDTVNTTIGDTNDFVWVSHSAQFTDPLTVNSGDTYTVNSGDTETYSNADVDGTLDVNGTLDLTAETQGETPGETRWDFAEWQTH